MMTMMMLGHHDKRHRSPRGDSVDGKGRMRSGKVGADVFGESLNSSWHVCSALSSFPLWSAAPHPPPLFFVAVIARHLFVLFLLLIATEVFTNAPWRFWRWKGRNHLNSCPDTEPLTLPDKAVRLHFGSGCQRKLSLPFSINVRRCQSPAPARVRSLHPLPAFRSAKCSFFVLPSQCLSAFSSFLCLPLGGSLPLLRALQDKLAISLLVSFL